MNTKINLPEITTVDDCLKICEEFIVASKSFNIAHSLNDMKYFYRGESNYSWNTTPSIFRDKLYKLEDRLIQETLLSCPEEFQNSEKRMFENLVKMQHYGLPTRLLDITSNPLIALYFSCLSYIDSEEQDGKFILFAGFPFYPSSDRVKILTYYSYNNLDSIISFQPIHKALNNLGVVLPDAYNNHEFHHYYQLVVNSDTIVFPALTNERIKKQNGAFIIFGNNNAKSTEKQPHNLEESNFPDNNFFIV